MLRVEVSTQLLRLRTLLALAFLAAVPVLSALSTAPHAGHRYGAQGGLYGASPFSALNLTMACLDFMANLMMPVVVAMLACAIGSSDRDWGILRYLYIAPVSRTRLLAGKLGALLIVAIATTLCVVAAGLIAGLAWFGWHPFHIIGAPVLSTGDAVGRAMAACGYITLCLLSIAAIAFALALLLPRGAEAVGASIAFVIAATILNGQSALHFVAVLLPVHYWQDWTQLFAADEPAHLGTGIVAQVATIAVAIAVAILILRRRDPAA